MNQRKVREALTLLELIVVIAIVAVLFGLMLPAAQRVRDAAARAACSNNLRQIGAALHAYHDSNNVLPAGMTYEDGFHSQPFLSWHARILPFIEQSSLWERTELAYRAERDFLKSPPHTVGSQPLALFGCPSDARTRLVSKAGHAFTSYLGVEGQGAYFRNGVLHLDSRVSLGMIGDGTSNTLAVGERPPSGDELFGWWYAGWGQKKNGSAEMILGVLERMEFGLYYTICERGPYTYRAGKINNVCDAFHFWSLHVDGGHFLFADGSVRFLPYSAAAMMPALASRSGSEVASEHW